MFIGEYKHNVDEKGRLAVPVKFRGDLAKGAVVTRGLDNCLFLYTKKEWQKLADKLASLPIAQANARAFARLMLSGAMDVRIDKQGRVVLPEYLRKYGKVKKKVVVAGLYNRLEIWDEKTWETYRAKTEKDSSSIAEKLGDMEIGI
ncbi:division/cell wall cluster transcriptional repressor MraZ [Candidatus Falkowbacteria bacterium]|jgi:MraZ protein|nr:division/cell wall cluster transcriptional repressor MraZ [Candidatus Falkowbacteria bacterium]MBT4433542.1 division/cell wall cluster transcriptional repressor MraZ [Candidatus Falkowbacteria bacterium]